MQKKVSGEMYMIEEIDLSDPSRKEITIMVRNSGVFRMSTILVSRIKLENLVRFLGLKELSNLIGIQFPACSASDPAVSLVAFINSKRPYIQYVIRDIIEHRDDGCTISAHNRLIGLQITDVENAVIVELMKYFGVDQPSGLAGKIIKSQERILADALEKFVPVTPPLQLVPA